MTEHDDRTREMQHDLEEMEEQSDRLEGEIDEAREDWERKKRDPSVPGAAGDPDRAEEDLPPEADEPS
jgi:hypothetical protein